MKILPVPLLSFAVLIIVWSIADRSLPLVPDGILMLAFTVAALTVFTWYSYRLKFVAVADNKLYVSGWFKHHAIPLCNVERIYYPFGGGLVFVDLKSPSAVGRRIVFIPTIGDALRGTLRSPSVVDDLRSRIAASKTNRRHVNVLRISVTRSRHTIQC